MKTFAIGVVALLSVPAFASGFRCESRDGYRVKIYNHTNAQEGTRTPAVFVLSHEDSGTLLVAKGAQISKRNLSNVVQYTAKGGQKGLDYAIAQITFKEGRETLAEGERAYGNLILAKNGHRQVSRIVCERYLAQ